MDFSLWLCLFLTAVLNQTLLQKALLIMNNIIARCSSPQCVEIVKLDFLVRLVDLINSPAPSIQEQAIWILDNIAVEGQHRLQIIEYGAVDSIIKVILLVYEKNVHRLITLIAAGPPTKEPTERY